MEFGMAVITSLVPGVVFRRDLVCAGDIDTDGELLEIQSIGNVYGRGN